ncbi:carboxylesterase family protein [Allokutzneria oryzae]|uniref:Carboxylesterase family protein n=1 Tax=Allokutzneria oryzae TaxID=1378989 RepID=A0ABV5ZXC2_9PSEU
MNRRARLGAVLWVLVAQYFVLLAVVESQWRTPYSWMRNAISDLGAATCFHSAQVDGWVCSPWYVASGVSWTLAGLCLTAGALLIRPLFPDVRTARIGLALFAVSGLGLAVVGLNPEDTSTVPHFLGAVVAIPAGEAAMLLTGLALARTARWRRLGRFGAGAAVVAAVAFVLMVAGIGGPGLFGLWERIAAFPVLLWAVFCGVALAARPAESRLLRPRWWIPLSAVTVVSFALLHLNQSPFWGWVIVVELLVGLALIARYWLNRRPLVQALAWSVAAVVLFATAVVVYPPPANRAAGAAGAGTTGVVHTQDGPVSGVYNGDRSVEIFAGVPYAMPPTGSRRWRPPEPPARRTEVLTANHFADSPMQSSSGFLARALTTVTSVPLANSLVNPYPSSEDPLYLNIWRSAKPKSQKLPVLVYVPGGGFVSGSGSLPVYDGENLARRGDVLTVTINYRLGVFGFLSHPELAAESEHAASGNYGLMDQIAALTWVKENIAAFGGDPDRVTIAGESAGGESVCILSVTPLAKGLVDGVIGSSGACMGTVGHTASGDQADTRAAAEEAGRQLSASLKGASVNDMRAMSTKDVYDAARKITGHWRPSIDGYVLGKAPSEIYSEGGQHDVPILAGSNADESSLSLVSPPDTDPAQYRETVRARYGSQAESFLRLYPGDTAEQVLSSTLQAKTDKIMTRAVHRWTRLQARTGRSDAYLYHFTHVPPEPALAKFGAYHGAEIMYAYDNLGKDGNAVYAAPDYRLRDQMSGYWANFAKTGDPNGPGLPRWNRTQDDPEQLMELSGDSRMIPRPRKEHIDFWMAYQGPVA